MPGTDQMEMCAYEVSLASNFPFQAELIVCRQLHSATPRSVASLLKGNGEGSNTGTISIGGIPRLLGTITPKRKVSDGCRSWCHD